MFNKVSKVFYIFMASTFFITSMGIQSYAAELFDISMLPAPGSMVNVSPVYVPAHLMGLQIDPQNPFHLDFLISNGQNKTQANDNQEEYLKMVKYFMASLTVPNRDQWVNLSPYESQRIISSELGITEMGRDLLSQDYILKQLTASLIYPEKEIGKEFWGQIYHQIYAKYGPNVKIPVNTFNKVWIMPESAVLYEKGNQVWIVKSRMNVMLEIDYLAAMKHQGSNLWATGPNNPSNGLSSVASDIIRNIVIPVIKKEVNTGKNFAVLRQIYNAMVLATWYKMELKQSILNKVYGDAKKVKGIDLNDNSSVETIYRQYLKAYKKGVFNYIKEDIDPVSQETIPRKYFSGGFEDDLDAPGILSRGRNLGIISKAMTTADREVFNTDAAEITKFSVSFTRVAKGVSAMAGLGLLMVAPQMAGAQSKAPAHTLHFGSRITTSADREIINDLFKVVHPQQVEALNGTQNTRTGRTYHVDMPWIQSNWKKSSSSNFVGRVTEAGVVAFQRMEHLPETGVLNQKTVEALVTQVSSVQTGSKGLSRQASAPIPTRIAGTIDPQAFSVQIVRQLQSIRFLNRNNGIPDWVGRLSKADFEQSLNKFKYPDSIKDVIWEYYQQVEAEAKSKSAGAPPPPLGGKSISSPAPVVSPMPVTTPPVVTSASKPTVVVVPQVPTAPAAPVVLKPTLPTVLAAKPSTPPAGIHLGPENRFISEPSTTQAAAPTHPNTRTRGPKPPKRSRNNSIPAPVGSNPETANVGDISSNTPQVGPLAAVGGNPETVNVGTSSDTTPAGPLGSVGGNRETINVPPNTTQNGPAVGHIGIPRKIILPSPFGDRDRKNPNEPTEYERAVNEKLKDMIHSENLKLMNLLEDLADSMPIRYESIGSESLPSHTVLSHDANARAYYRYLIGLREFYSRGLSLEDRKRLGIESNNPNPTEGISSYSLEVAGRNNALMNELGRVGQFRNNMGGFGINVPDDGTIPTVTTLAKMRVQIALFERDPHVGTIFARYVNESIQGLSQNGSKWYPEALDNERGIRLLFEEVLSLYPDDPDAIKAMEYYTRYVKDNNLQGPLKSWHRTNRPYFFPLNNTNVQASGASNSNGTSPAQLTPDGGINFDAAQLSMVVKKDGQGMPLPFNLQDPALMHISGLEPFVIGIQLMPQSQVPHL